jgi:polysaccharide deacetylase 2 family uncharacterized protein YibQ
VRAAIQDSSNDMLTMLDKKADLSELHALMAEKPDMQTLHNYLGSKLEDIEINRARIDN